MVNGVLTIPLSGTSFGPSPEHDTRARRLSAFVAGSENAVAVAALTPFLDGTPGAYNPLVLYGPHGSGKSHLAYGLAELWRRRFADASVQYLSGSDFARQCAAALADGRLDEWRAELGGAALLVLDDLGELADKRPAQLELLRTLDAMTDRGAAVVVTARTLPSHWPILLPALRGRLSAGLAVPLAVPARAARRAILERLAAQRGVSFTGRALSALAAALQGGVPTLIAAILELELTACEEGRSVDHERVRQLVAPRAAAIDPTLRQIACRTARYFGLKLADLKSPVRRRALVVSRGVAMYLARQLTSNSLGQIGAFFGGRDHTTVLYGCRRTENLLRRDRAVRQAVVELRRLLSSPMSAT
ncbi:MAG: DnaA/Hda family protein [Pirellulales bacterium]